MAEAKAQINASTVLGSLLCGHVRGKDKVISKKGGAFVVRSKCLWLVEGPRNYRPYVMTCARNIRKEGFGPRCRDQRQSRFSVLFNDTEGNSQVTGNRLTKSKTPNKKLDKNPIS